LPHQGKLSFDELWTCSTHIANSFLLTPYSCDPYCITASNSDAVPVTMAI